jgi:hypothetical protein
MKFDRRMFLLMGGGTLYAQSSPPIAPPPKGDTLPGGPDHPPGYADGRE